MLGGQERTNYPITLSVDDLGEGFALTAQTDRRIDPQRVIGYLHTALESLVEALEQAPQTPALSLSILPESERQQVLELFNATQAAYPQEQADPRAVRGAGGAHAATRWRWCTRSSR